MKNLRSELTATIARIGSNGWCPATSGNFSARIASAKRSKSGLRMLMTPSGVDKTRLKATQLIEIDQRGKVLKGKGAPSAEYLLHVALYDGLGVSAILHSHSVWNTILSRAYLSQGRIEMRGYELLKALNGVTTHDHTEIVPILENSQDMNVLSAKVRALCGTSPGMHGFLLAGHGLYTWGDSIYSAYRHLEAFEFLFEVVARESRLSDGGRKDR